jgi:hypothetical protein
LNTRSRSWTSRRAQSPALIPLEIVAARELDRKLLQARAPEAVGHHLECPPRLQLFHHRTQIVIV